VTTRRDFVLSAAALAAAPSAGQKGISLALWSLNRSFFAGHWKLLEVPGILRNQLGIVGLEYVNQFFENPTLSYLQKLRRACSDNGVQSLLLMVDNEGATASADRQERKDSEIAHRKWIDIAHYLGCKNVRCNMYGGAEDWKSDKDIVLRAAETFRNLVEYAKGSGLNIIVENHGRASSDPDNLIALVKAVNSPEFGLLVDLGNWNKGDDRYACVRKTIAYGRALSVKGTFGPSADPAFDMEKLLKTALDGGYQGWWAIEVTPRTAQGEKPSAAELYQREIALIKEVKAITERVVFQKG